MRRLLPVLFVSLICSCALGQQTDLLNRTFSVQELQTDLDSLYKWVTETHPSLYVAINQQQADRNWEKLRSGIDHPMGRMEFLRKILPLLTQYRDGHTGLSPEFDLPEFELYKKKGGKLFPLTVMIKQNRIWCAENYLDNGLAIPGDEILSINGKSSKDIMQELLPVWPADDHASNEVIVARLFSFTLWLNDGWGDKCTVQLKKSNGKANITLKGMDPDTYLNRYFGKMQAWKLELMPDKSLAVISSGVYNSSENVARRFLDSAFKVIKDNRIAHLAFDIRNNGGGNSSLGRMLLGYVYQQPSTSIKSKSFRSSAMLDALPVDHWIGKQYRNARKDWKAVSDGYMMEFVPQEANVPANKELLFTGKFYLLISPRTFSSAHMTAMEVKCYKMATIIGEPTGERMNLSGEVIGFTLPNTRLDGIVPTARYTTACGNGNQVGVQPDILISVTPTDLLAGKDPVMDALKKLCK